MNDPLLGRVIDGRYRLEALLGTGGLGAVYRATQLRLDRAIAVKVLHEQHAANEELRARFDREARSLAALSHPNVIPVVDCGVDEGRPYLVMELMEGQSLDDALTEGMDLERALHIAIEVASALAYAHERGIIHRDLKPGNIFLQETPDGREAVRVLDFGLAKFLVSNTADLTRAGIIMGTPGYIPPEQASGDRITPRTDIYSLGIVLFEMITGSLPFEGEMLDVIRAHINTPVPSIATRRSAFHGLREFDAVISKACAKEPQDRYADGTALRNALIEVRDTLFFVDGPRSASWPALRVSTGSRAIEADAALPTTLHAAPSTSGPPRPIVLGLAALFVVLAALVTHQLMASPETDVWTVMPLAIPNDAWVAQEDAPTLNFYAAQPTDAGVADASEAPHAGPVAAPTTELVDPWTRERSRVLERFRNRILTTPLSRAERRHIRAWIRTHPRDCRGHLAYGHAFMSYGARGDAVAQYREALETEPEARADAQLRINLVRIAAWNGSPEEGAALAREVYGADIVPDIDAMLLVLDPSEPEARRAAGRLRALRHRVLR